jgi:hypothetical protein
VGSAEGRAASACAPALAAGSSSSVPTGDAGQPVEAPDPVPSAPDSEAVAHAPRPLADGERWRRAVDAVQRESARLGAALANGRFLGLTADGVRLAFAPEARFHRSSVFGASRSQIEQLLADSLGRPIRLLEETSAAAFEAAPKSLAEEATNLRQHRERDVEQRVRQHPSVRAIARVLGGSIEHIRVLEVEAPAARAATTGDDDG